MMKRLASISHAARAKFEFPVRKDFFIALTVGHVVCWGGF